MTFCNIIYQLQQYFFDFYYENKPILSKNRLIFIPVIPGNRFPFPGTSGNEYFREIPGNPGNGIPGNQPYSGAVSEFSVTAVLLGVSMSSMFESE